MDDDDWLYGDSNAEAKTSSEIDCSQDGAAKDDGKESENVAKSAAGTEPVGETEEDSAAVRLAEKEVGELSGGEDDTNTATAVSAGVDAQGEDGGDGQGNDEGDSDDSDSDDDDVQVTIGDIKTSPGYSYGATPVNLNIKRGATYPGGPTQTSVISKTKGIDLEAVGTINGVPCYEFNLDSLEDKPWRKPGADITDYFNYGFNEDSWKTYCDKQRKLRGEGGTPQPKPAGALHTIAKDQQIPVASITDLNALKKAGPPPGRKLAGSIDVIGGTTSTSRRSLMNSPKENVIQVMTGEKRDYVRKPFLDSSMPPPGLPPMGPPGFLPPDLSVPPPGMPPPPGLPPGLPPPPGMLPPPPAGMIATIGTYPPSDPFGAFARFPVPPPSVVSTITTTDRIQPPGYDGHTPFFGGGGGYGHFDAGNEAGWEPRDRPDSAFSQTWDFSNERSGDRSPGTEERHAERHRDRDGRETRDRDRSSRDKDRERDRDRDRDRDRSLVRDRDSRRDGREGRGEGREGRGEGREGRGDGRDERERSRERDRGERSERSGERSERRDDRDDYEERRERRHRERDREKEHRSSRRKHRDDDESSEHRSSRHRRKRSKRIKEEDEGGAGEASGDGPTNDDGDGGSTPPLPVDPKEIKKEKD